jgi:hypothetical protein
MVNGKLFSRQEHCVILLSLIKVNSSSFKLDKLKN